MRYDVVVVYVDRSVVVVVAGVGDYVAVGDGIGVC